MKNIKKVIKEFQELEQRQKTDRENAIDMNIALYRDLKTLKEEYECKCFIDENNNLIFIDINARPIKGGLVEYSAKGNLIDFLERHNRETEIIVDPKEDEEHEEKIRHYTAWRNFDVKEAIRNNPDIIKELSDYIHTGERKKTCPRCGAYITFHPAISRKDNETEICSDCGVIEAIEEYAAAEKK